MTRKEMIEKLDEYCESVPFDACPTCPIRKTPVERVGCEHLEQCTDSELAACIEKIMPAPKDMKAAVESCENEPDRPTKRTVEIDRDELCAMRGRLLMFSCLIGVTITSAMADEMLFMSEVIEAALGEGEDIAG